MRRFKLYSVLILLLALWVGTIFADTFTLADGSIVSGNVVSYNDNDMVVNTGNGEYKHVRWQDLSADTLKQLQQDPKAAKYVEPYIEQLPETKAKARQIIIKPVPKPERPTDATGFLTLFKSPLGLVILLLVYVANIYAAYEVAVFRERSPAIPCALAAIPFIGLVSPILFLCIMTERPAPVPLPTVEVSEPPTASAPEAATSSETPVAEPTPTALPPSPPMATPPARPAHQAPSLKLGSHQTPTPAANAPEASAPTTVTFKRGEFTFNRRFFETKMPGFFRMVPSETEKDMVLAIKSARGSFVGKRIMNITQSELTLQIFKENVTADEVIPFSEISEVQIRHKDTPA